MGKRPISPARKRDAEAAIFAAELGAAPTLDLHGERAENARHELEAFIDREFLRNTPAIKIIHGRGDGILQRMAGTVLSRHPLVEYSRGSSRADEAGAVTYAALVTPPPSLPR